MLFATARVLDREIDDAALASEEPAAAGGELNRVKRLGAFEDIEAPGLGGGRFSRLGGFVVFENDGGAGDSVGFGGEEARGGEVWFLLLGSGARYGD